MRVPPRPTRWRRALAALVCAVAARAATAAEAPVAVIVAAGAWPASLGAEELAAVYRRQRQFVAGVRVQPVNLPTSHALRRWFSQQVLRQSPEEMEGYWRDLYFNGVVPPFVLASEEAVIRFVAANPGAIGYVSGCALDKRVRVIVQFDAGPPCSR